MRTHFNLVDGKPTLWDSPREDTIELNLVQFKDGSYGLLTEKQAVATQQVVDYLLESEEIDFEQTGGMWNGADPNLHIVHSLRALDTVN